MLKSILKLLFILVLIVLVAGGLIGAFLLAGYALEQALIFSGIIFAIGLVFILIRKLVIRLRAKAQVKRILQEGDPEAINALPVKQGFVGDLKKNWHLALRALKRSQLKLQGDPLYVLPWFMIFGRPGSGKSTALRAAKLLSPEIDFPDHLEGSTATLEWWLYEQAIVIDTAGRYAVPGDKQDREEWRTLLDMLAKSKQKEPLNGLVIAIAADRLLKNNDDSLMEEGRQVRASISDLMNHLEAKPPIYLMVTKCDLIEGFSEWCDYLPEEAKLQPMGYLNEAEGGDYESIVDRALDTVLDRMKSLRLLLLERSHNPNDSVLTAPIALEGLRSRLQIFIKTALKENIYQETPKFRGLYFSSSAPSSNSAEQAKRAYLRTKTENLTEAKTGLFLHQFFTRVLPSDRGLIESLSTAVRARRALYTYTLSGMGILTLLLILGLSGLFTRDVARLSQIKSAYQKIDLKPVGINEKLHTLNRLRELILDLEAARKSWIFPWTGSFGRPAQLSRMIHLYQEHFRNDVLEALDRPLMERIIALETNETSRFATGLVRRVNHLSHCLDGNCDDFAALSPITHPYVLLANSEIKEESAALFNGLYRSYLSWTTAPILLQDERRQLRVRLLQVLEKYQNNFDWLITWANQQGGSPVHISDFWVGSVVLADTPAFIPAAYTLRGRDTLLDFWEELSRAYDKGQVVRIRKIRSEFNDYYERRYIKSWLNFIKKFDQGQGKLRDANEWLNALEQMASEGNPYFELIERVAIALAPIQLQEGFPARPFFNFYNKMKDAPLPGEDGVGVSANQAQHFLEKAGKAAQTLIKGLNKAQRAQSKVNRLAGSPPDRFEAIKLEDAAKTLDDYKKALSETAFYAESRTQSASTVSNLFKPSAGSAGGSPASLAETAIESLKKLSRKSKDDDLFWSIYTGPLRVAYRYMKNETDCYLQDKWEETVLAEIEGVPDNQRINRLIQEGDGLVWKYVKGEAAPFLDKRQGRMYRPSFVNGQNINWTEDYTDYINQAEEAKKLVGKKFTVSFGALPTGVNMSAKIAPYSVILELHCADKTYTLENFNYYVRAQFDWSMESCGEVTLQIEIGELTLRKTYKDQFGNGFSLFLQEFRDGRHVFVSEDFPDKKEQLDEKNVKAIDVSYEITGQEPIIKILETVPLVLPTEVTRCWS